MKTCTGCKETKPLTGFAKNKQSKDGHQTKCKVCRQKAHTAYHQANKEQRNTYARAYRESHLEQYRHYDFKYRSAGVFGELEKLPTGYMEAMSRVYGRCLACGRTDNLQPDHVVALAAAGSNTLANLQLLCGDCNNKKDSKTQDYRQGGILVDTITT